MYYKEIVLTVLPALLVVVIYLTHDKIKDLVGKIGKSLERKPKQKVADPYEEILKKIESLVVASANPRLIVHRGSRVVTMEVPALVTDNATHALLEIGKILGIACNQSQARSVIEKITIDGVDKTGYTCGEKIKNSSVVEVWL